MKLYLSSLMLVGVFFISSIEAIAIDDFASAGEITGRVNYCGEGGSPDVLVYIPGRSFHAKTDVDGNFQLSYVPTGEYRIIFEQGDQQIGAVDRVRVSPKRMTRLGVLDFCNTCPEIFAPVCGVDGVTFANECFANSAGVNIAPDGDCEHRACTTEYAPVCGVDGVTYANMCLASGAGVEIAHAGRCEHGVCPMDFTPTCGVDGITYGNQCEASYAGVEIAHAGKCNLDLFAIPLKNSLNRTEH